MNLFSFITSAGRSARSRRSLALLVVGVTVGVAIGGVGVSRASTSQSVTFCVNKKTQVVRLPKTGRCARTETRLPMNTTGVAGAVGPAGPTGATGPAGPAGAAGAQGPQGSVGQTGPTGPQGIQGLQGIPGAAGAAGPQWAFAGESFFGLDGSTNQRATGYTIGFDATDEVERFRVICWLELSTPKHVIEYDRSSGETVISTAHTVGGSSSTTVRLATGGTVDVGAVRSVDTRHEVMVLGPGSSISMYEIVVAATVNECRVSFASHG